MSVKILINSQSKKEMENFIRVHLRVAIWTVFQMALRTVPSDQSKEVFLFFFVGFVFSGPHLQHMEVPSLGVK